VDDEKPTPTCVALVGLRGAGKSSVGAVLARKLAVRFAEVDQIIESEAAVPLSTFFELYGERHYRAIEHNVLRTLLDDDSPKVLAVSGGVVNDDVSWRLLKQRSFTVWLRATPETHWQRVVRQGDDRPMAGRSRARLELEEIHKARATSYQESQCTVDTDALDENAVADVIVDELARVHSRVRERI
jgi:XRE family transcriptional regulator, aerobic/anaerobic benzoate catabolism transcriptional regulator